jgi:predicted small secreted protein
MTTAKINQIFVVMPLAVTLLGFIGMGCKHTANGAGKDIEQMGEKIQEKTR